MINRLLGQYNNKGTFIHALDPRLKIIFIAIFSSVLALANNPIKLFSAGFFIILLLISAKVGFGYLARGLKPFLFIYLFIFIMYLAFSRDKMLFGMISLWKFTLLIFMSLILTTTTTLSNLVKGIERLLSPLRYIGLNPRNIALMLSITIRFIPQFFLYGNRIKDAQESRLSSFKRIRHIKLFITKLFNRMIESADTLSNAIEARCYDIKNSSVGKFKELKFAGNDYFAMLAGTLIFILIWLI